MVDMEETTDWRINMQYVSQVDETGMIMEAHKIAIDNYWFLIEPVDNSIPQNNPKELKSEIDTILGANMLESIRFTRKGTIVTNTKHEEVALSLCNLKELLGVKVKVKLIKDHITTRFVLKNINTNIRLNEMAEEIERVNGFKILEIQRFTTKKDNVKTPSTTILVTIIGHKIPSQLKLWYQIFNIEIFVDKPRQCFKCGKYNHSPKFCTQNKICFRCGNAEHLGKNCIPKCVNCSESHEASDKNCKCYLNEVEINKLRAEMHLPLSEARLKYYAKSKNKSFAITVSNQQNQQYITRNELNKALTDLTNSFRETMSLMLKEQANYFMSLLATNFKNSDNAAKESEVESLESLPMDVSQENKSQRKRKRKKGKNQPNLNSENIDHDYTRANGPVASTSTTKSTDFKIQLTGNLNT